MTNPRERGIWRDEVSQRQNSMSQKNTDQLIDGIDHLEISFETNYRKIKIRN